MFDFKSFEDILRTSDPNNLHDWPLKKDLEINKEYFIVTPPLYDKLKNKYGVNDNDLFVLRKKKEKSDMIKFEENYQIYYEKVSLAIMIPLVIEDEKVPNCLHIYDL